MQWDKPRAVSRRRATSITEAPSMSKRSVCRSTYFIIASGHFDSHIFMGVIRPLREVLRRPIST